MTALPVIDPTTHHALVVGIQHYREYTPLKSPRRDAARFCRWLEDVAGLPAENIHLVAGDGDGTPTNDDILQAVDSLGPRLGTRKGSRLYVYYAGHGLGPTCLEVALLPANAGINRIEYQCFGVGKWLDYFVRTRLFDEVILFLDCCRQEQSVETIGLPYRPVRLFEKAIEQQINYFALMGSGHGGVSVEQDQRGLMTDALLEGLNGAPGAVDPASGNVVTTASLQRYVMARVAEHAEFDQKVEPWAMTATPMTLRVLPAIPQVTLTIVVGAETAGRTLHLLNPKTLDLRVLGAAGEGTALPPVEIAANTRHQLSTDDLSWQEILDPSKMTDPYELRLP